MFGGRIVRVGMSRGRFVGRHNVKAPSNQFTVLFSSLYRVGPGKTLFI